MIDESVCESCTALTRDEVRALNKRYSANLGLMAFAENLTLAAEVMRGVNELYTDERIRRDPLRAQRELGLIDEVVAVVRTIDEKTRAECVRTLLEHLRDGAARNALGDGMLGVLHSECLSRDANSAPTATVADANSHATGYAELASRVRETFGGR